MSRKPMPAAMPADVAERLSDQTSAIQEARWEAERDRIEADASEAAEILVKDADWWNDRLEGICALTREVPQALARCMVNLDAAYEGDKISKAVILTSLRILQRQARADAYDEEIGRASCRGR